MSDISDAADLLDHAEILHAEHHPGTFVPTLSDCPDHATEEYLRLAASVEALPEAKETSLRDGQSRMAELEALGERAKRIFAVCRWAGVIAVIEMTDGYDTAMEVVKKGPQEFMPNEDEWALDNLSESAKVAINYIEAGETP